MAHKLDLNQKRAVEIDGNLLVSACPGSGKTRVLSFRAARLIKERKRVITVSFTRDSANSLLERIRDLVPGGITPGLIESGTFHSLALNQIKRSGKVRDQEILRTQDWILMIRQALFTVQREEKFPFGKEPEEETRIAIEYYAANAIDPLSITPSNGAQRAAQEFTAIKRKHQRYDFGDMLLMAIQGMEDGSIPPYQHEYMLVDEYQDADTAQYKWLMAHIKAGTKVTVVGDDDQAIYSWRHAAGYAGMMNFMNETKAAHIKLPTNYRCASDILDHSAKLIQRNLDRVDKQLQAFKSEKGIVAAKHVSDEIDFVTQVINCRQKITNNGRSIAIIGRTNFILRKIALLLAAQQIPFELMGGGGIANVQEIQALLGLIEAAYERVPSKAIPRIANPLRWLGYSEESIVSSEKKGNRSVELFVDFMKTEHRDSMPDPWQKEAIDSLAANLSNWLTNARKDNHELVILSVARWLSDATDAKKFHQWNKRPGDREEPAEPSRIIQAIARIMSRAKGSIKQRISVVQQLGTKKDEEDEEKWVKIKLMTMHKSKGLEYDIVWIANAEDGVCPLVSGNATTNLLSPEMVAEERRLFYVAMTRAISELYITYSLNDKSTPSVFIGESGIIV